MNPLSALDTLQLDLGNAALLVTGQIEYMFYRINGFFRVYIPTLGWYGPDTPEGISAKVKQDVAYRMKPPAVRSASECSPSVHIGRDS